MGTNNDTEHRVTFVTLANGDTGWSCTCGETGLSRERFRAERYATEHVNRATKDGNR
jgi:hypothetical protein